MMEKKEKRLLFAVSLITFVLIFTAVSAGSLWNHSNPGVTGDLMPEKAVQKEKIDTLEVSYWNPWGGPTDHGRVNLRDWPYSLAEYYNESVFVVSATVTDSVKWTNETEEGAEKLEELGSPYLYSWGIECTLKVDDVLKGDYDIDTIHLKTDANSSFFNVGDEYILFITLNGEDYTIQPASGYLLKNGSNYEGMVNISTTKEDLLYLGTFSSDELDLYHEMAYLPQIFIGEMLTSTNDADLVHLGGSGTKQEHQVRVISSVRGNLSGTVDFTYYGSYITDEMMQDYIDKTEVRGEDSPTHLIPDNNGGYYVPQLWDPETSPLQEGNVYLFCLRNFGSGYEVSASTMN